MQKKKVGDIAPRFKTCSPDRLFLHDAGTSLTTGINAGKVDLCRTTGITLFLSVANVCLIKIFLLSQYYANTLVRLSHLVKVRKTSRSGLKYRFDHHDHGWRSTSHEK